ncbi:hypothetical protein FJTKL_04009 [Diaporthe vaccinii]|uniref:Uncharacterized protein n=1 Tax=Diaporthe vaccinii TaxID=105482 RepID=A0ABR4DU91_9PEZI
MYIQQSFFTTTGIRCTNPPQKARPVPELHLSQNDRPSPLVYIESDQWYIQFDTEWCLCVCCRSMEEDVRNLPNARRVYPSLPPYAMHIRLSS